MALRSLNLARMTRRSKLRKIAKRALAERLREHGRRQHAAAIQAKRPGLPRIVQREMRLKALEEQKRAMAEKRKSIATRLGIAAASMLLLLALPGIADADCRHFFYKQQVAVVAQQVVYPAVAISPYIYQAGRDVEADALAAKVARLVVPQIVQQLQAQPLTQQQSAPTSLLAQKCAKCHSGATPKGELVFDGKTFVPDAAYRKFHKMAGLGEGIPPEMEQVIKSLTVEEKGRLSDEMLALEPPAPPRLP